MPHLAAGDLVMGVNVDDLENPLPTQAQVGHYSKGWPRTIRVHSSLSRLVHVMGEDILSYKVITLARNPWDRAVSEFYDNYRNTDIKSHPLEVQRETFTRFVHKVSRLTFSRRLIDRLEGRNRACRMVQSELCNYKGRFRADHVIFYESLGHNIAEVGNALGIDLKLPTQKAKGEWRAPASRDWRSFYTDETRALIAQCCRVDIDLYGYQYDGDRLPNLQNV
ncbi:sulfotransferase family 2 domain-containing protein [Tabrizicola sp. KVB23]|uniref:Sulfotransferase family 2 domain-containing protein n=2 Tax=Fuscibacter oryzae TaxID=2803939 RepID=A0A8J7MN43_9RHOB|nr:sulfotransferase family 2 domain-containing protein [Fuscibacter oryzae]